MVSCKKDRLLMQKYEKNFLSLHYLRNFFIENPEIFLSKSYLHRKRAEMQLNMRKMSEKMCNFAALFELSKFLFFMNREISKIVDTMCQPGIVSMEPSDLAFLNECENYSINELFGDSVKDAVASIDASTLRGYKNVAVNIISHKNDRYVSVNEIAQLKPIFEHLDKDANVVWSFTFSDVPVGKRKVMLLLAS